MNRENQGQQAARFKKQRNFLVVLPLMALPFFTFLLWSIGMIGTAESKAATVDRHGFNASLPPANPVRDSNWNKLQFYERADKDSARYKAMLKNDPYYAAVTGDTSVGRGLTGRRYRYRYDPSPPGLQKDKDPNEEKIYKKLAALNEQLKRADNPAPLKQQPLAGSHDKSAALASLNPNDIERLEDMLQAVHQKDTGVDPEMDKLNTMLDKVMAIQHPQPVEDKIKQQSETHKKQVFPVVASSNGPTVSLLQNQAGRNVARDSFSDTVLPVVPSHNGFYSLTDAVTDTEQQNAVEAVTQETQTLVSGSTIKLRLATDIYVKGIRIPKGQSLFGTAKLSGERLNVDITTLRYGNNILPVALSAFDLDGMAGIYIPGAITRDAAKQSAGQAVQGVGLSSLDPSIGAQAATAGIEAAKTLIGKKLRLVKVTVKDGYKILLRDSNSAESK